MQKRNQSYMNKYIPSIINPSLAEQSPRWNQSLVVDSDLFDFKVTQEVKHSNPGEPQTSACWDLLELFILLLDATWLCDGPKSCVKKVQMYNLSSSCPDRTITNWRSILVKKMLLWLSHSLTTYFKCYFENILWKWKHLFAFWWERWHLRWVSF